MLPSDAAMGDDVGHGERLVRTGHAHQTLAMATEIEPVGKPLDGFGLIALRENSRWSVRIVPSRCGCQASSKLKSCLK